LRQRVRRTEATDCRDSRTPFLGTGAQRRAVPVSVPQPPDCPASEHQLFLQRTQSPLASRSGLSIDVSAAASAGFGWFPPCLVYAAGGDE
jgi:hypothetical protein